MWETERRFQRPKWNIIRVDKRCRLPIFPAFVKQFLPGILLLASTVAPLAQQIDEPYRVSTLALAASGDPIGSHANFEASDVAVNTAGEVIIADRGHNTIRKIALNGAVTTVAGYYGAPGQLVDGPGRDARFDWPSSLAVDAAGTIYVADTDNHVIRKITPDGMVSTLAGGFGGHDGGGSADGIGRQARFNYPSGIAVDLNGFIYVADQGNATVRKITPDAVVTTLAGQAGSHAVVDGQGSAARFNTLSGITTDALGNIYVADCACIRKITPEGYVTTLAGVGCAWGYVDGMGASARFNGLEGITASPSGDLFVVDAGNALIRKITPAGNVTTLAGGYPPLYIGDFDQFDGIGSQARFYVPKGITADNNGMLYVAEGRVRTVTPGGLVTTLPAASLFATNHNPPDDTGEIPPLDGVKDITIDAAGNIYVAELFHGAVRKISPDRVITTLRPMVVRSDGRRLPAFVSINAMAIDREGNIFFGSTSYVGKIDPAGDISVFAGDIIYSGSADGIGPAARFSQVQRLILDDQNNLYVGDIYNCTVRKITPEAVVTTLAGSAGNCGNTDGVGAAARFAWPEGLALDSTGNIYVADGHYDAISNTIRKIGLDGVVTTIAGSPGTYGYADGIGTAAHFYHPTAVTVNRNGDVLVADSWNGRLRKVTPAGVVTTLAGRGQSFSIDGVGDAASFGSLNSMVSDSVGNRYIVDSGGAIRIASSTLKTHALNVSTRLQVLENENVLIGGFIIGGTSRKSVILRALGPSLAAYNVQGVLPDPVLELYDSGGHLIASNDSWKLNAQTGMSQQAAVEATTLAPGNDLEAAIIATLDPQQGYTAVVRGRHGETGISNVELYDLNSSSTASLANISTRGLVESGDKVMIGGFILGGNNGSGEVVVRALGPSLAQSGIANPLGNPTLALINGNGQLIAFNDDWEETNGAAIRAAGLQPTSNLESAILASLPAGAYTAVVQGHNESGVGLVEVYNLP
jgi:sugar lactone lactonase YvrE